ncbi:lipid-transfer protein [Prauserella sp. PE36]|uniref:propanoyl-CoA C-acyltransferase n=1 Tax=Prauserella endophytica TaxID=1592324 RepID=A0ABY2S103_9PSEU|nr:MULTISPECIES: beta-ketoacyl synthase N-terminal-like domain-containing protein [Prauserella]RBM10336.1 lipid-transfer protein [Prauserella sp. PE36]TKG68352.1 lipid-transfer protein [Prauserella endophytica]
MSNRVFVIGVGMSPFAKPGTKEGDYPDWVTEAGTAALAEATIRYEQIERAFVGYVYGDSPSGQRALYGLGLTGIPIINVDNACATGSTALYLAREAVQYGLAECTLAAGFEKMERGSLGAKFPDRASPMDRHIEALQRLVTPEDVPFAPQMFGNAGREHMREYGSAPHHFAWIGWKNHKHSVHNPYAQFQQEYTLEEVEQAKVIHDPLTKLQCSPTSDGAACAVLASERFVDANDLWANAVEITAQSMVTDTTSTFDTTANCRTVVGYDMSLEAAGNVYAAAGIEPSDLDVIELHDCFSTNELITYEALGLAPEGEGHKLVETRATTYGGNGPVVNPSGGLISKGHPLGATGLAQCAELCWQLRGAAGARQVPKARTALQHNLGLGGAAVLTVYQVTGR